MVSRAARFFLTEYGHGSGPNSSRSSSSSAPYQAKNERRSSLTWIVLVAILMMTVISYLSPYFFTVANMTNLMKQMSIVAILAAGQAIVIISAVTADP